MKKIVKLSLVLLMAMFMIGNVYAANGCDVSVESNKTQLSKGEEFAVDFKISNIKSEKGIISLGATLEYDKDSLELVKMEGKNGWETPAEGASYNQKNGKIAITRSGLGKNNETVFTATFKVKETSKQNLVVTLKNVTVADGVAPATAELAYQNITVKDGTENPIPGVDDTNTTPNENTSTGNNIVANNSNKTSMTNNPLPKTGGALATGFLLIVMIAVFVAITLFRRMRFIDNEIVRETKRENKK